MRSKQHSPRLNYVHHYQIKQVTNRLSRNTGIPPLQEVIPFLLLSSIDQRFVALHQEQLMGIFHELWQHNLRLILFLFSTDIILVAHVTSPEPMWMDC